MNIDAATQTVGTVGRSTCVQKTLTITHCRKRKRGKDWQRCEPSRFIAELAQEDVRYGGEAAVKGDPAAEREAAKDRLQALRAKHDPDGLFHSYMALPP